MSSEALETMLKQQQEQVKIFRKIISKEIPSKIIKENDDAIAVLEIRPISKGHSLIIPKNEIKDAKELSPKTIELSQEISKEIQKKLNPKSIEIQTENKFGEIIINIIPIYDEKLDIFSDRMESTESELDKTYQEIIKEEKKSEKSEKKKEIPSEIVKLKRRIP
jgi:histidine triad (HIT) family protein